nr:uncharacterized protein LOC109155321 [Ipomoea batatas]
MGESKYAYLQTNDGLYRVNIPDFDPAHQPEFMLECVSKNLSGIITPTMGIFSKGQDVVTKDECQSAYSSAIEAYTSTIDNFMPYEKAVKSSKNAFKKVDEIFKFKFENTDEISKHAFQEATENEEVVANQIGMVGRATPDKTFRSSPTLDLA